MKHEKILKRADGSKTKIKIDSFVNYSNELNHRVEVQSIAKFKRKWPYMDMRDGRNDGTATAEEIHKVKLELWEKMKPIMDKD